LSIAVGVSLAVWVIPSAAWVWHLTAKRLTEATPTSVISRWMQGDEPLRRWGALVLVGIDHWYLLLAAGLSVRLLFGRAPIVLRRAAMEFSDE